MIRPSRQLRQALAHAGDQRQDRHAEFAREFFGIDLVPVVSATSIMFSAIDRRDSPARSLASRNKDCAARFEASTTTTINDWRRQFRQTIQQHVARNLFIERLRTQTVSARQIENPDIRDSPELPSNRPSLRSTVTPA